ncbi:hypothetical protein [Micromonospora sagamiensis]|uniref:Uncharacterized protein n=1 Tax=Micromonospora sagamiensis TaxID=47875 RepID=A0A562WC73_9ACTN|nr:hypothetical protein [Micromonospora sagamiensis]TWJ27870.1 hypothetical protein JD81_01370 [Micromonospora sagamiensis]BCL13241.1 hypothetical protein GCM10017556_09800 [Micromonospora sagamiensis]
MNAIWRLGTYLLVLLVIFSVMLIIGRLIGPISSPAESGEGHDMMMSTGQVAVATAGQPGEVA